MYAKKLQYIDDSTFLKYVTESRNTKEVADKCGLVGCTSVKNRMGQLLSKKELEEFYRKAKSNYRQLKVEELELIVKNSHSWTSIYYALGYNSHSGKLGREFRQYLNEVNIDYSHLMLGHSWQTTEEGKEYIAKNAKRTLAIPLDDILVENSTYNNSLLKKRLLTKGKLENKCYICGMKPFWNGKPLTMILDHINGIRNDNRLVNLRLTCGNCGLQLETHAGKNKSYQKKKEAIEILNQQPRISSNGKIIPRILKNVKPWQVNTCASPNCPAKIAKSATLCDPCNRIKTRKTDRPTGKQVRDEVLQHGYRATGKKYGVTDNAVKRWIINADLTPPRFRKPRQRKINVINNS